MSEQQVASPKQRIGEYLTWEVESVGTPWSLQSRSKKWPTCKPGQVLVETAFSALNFADGLMLEGKYQVRPSLPFVPGHEFAGTVIESADTAALPVGSRVAAQVPYGALGGCVTIDIARCALVPDALTLDLAAASLVSYTTAYVAIHGKANIQPGQTLLVHAAAGGLGAAVVQLAKVAGARVIGVVGSEVKRAAALEAGCDHVLLSSEDWPAAVQTITGGGGIHAALDSVGGDATLKSLKLLAWGGTLLIVGFSSGDITSIPVNRLLLKAQNVMGVYWSYEINPVETMDLQARVLELVAAGKVKPAVDSVFPAAQLEAALEIVMKGRSRGKVLVQWQK